MSRISYKNVVAFKKDLAKRIQGFDYEASIRLPRNHFVDTEGNIYRPRSAYEMFRVINDTFGECIVVDQSRKMIAKWIVTYKTTGAKVEKEPVNEEVSEETNTPEKIVEEKKFDKDFAKSLLKGDDIKKVKEALSNYGEEWGITLKKNKTPENMLKDLVKSVTS